MAPWEATTASTIGPTTVNLTENLTLANAGNLICNNAVVTLTVIGVYVTAMALSGSGIAWSLTSDDPFAADGVYTIDCAAESVMLNGSTDAYAAFALGSGHTKQTWLPLAAGNNAITVTADGRFDTGAGPQLADNWQ